MHALIPEGQRVSRPAEVEKHSERRRLRRYQLSARLPSSAGVPSNPCQCPRSHPSAAGPCGPQLRFYWKTTTKSGEKSRAPPPTTNAAPLRVNTRTSWCTCSTTRDSPRRTKGEAGMWSKQCSNFDCRRARWLEELLRRVTSSSRRGLRAGS